MSERTEHVTAAYRGVMTASIPAVRWWGRMRVSGLEHLPLEGPVLLAGNHDSNWDPISIGMAGLPRRQIKALAKASLWKPGMGAILDGMAQIPIDRGKGDIGALDRAVEELERGACIGVFPEGTRSKGRELRARSGFGRLAERVPAAQIVCVTATGTVDISRFPRDRPHVRVEFFLPAGGGMQPSESATDFGTRLLDELRERAPRVASGGPKRRAAAATR